MNGVHQELKINKSCLTECCKGNQKSAGGFIWKYLDDEINDYSFYIKKSRDKKVIQLDLHTDDEIICWLSVTAAATNIHTHRSAIANVCNGNQKTAGGFKWRYLDVSI